MASIERNTATSIEPGLPQSHVNPEPAPAPVNPLVARVRLPGETFTLPSGGLFYTNGELDQSVNNAEVHVYPMTIIDEIVLKTPDLLFSGEAVRQVFSRCVPQVIKPLDMLAKDVDFLLLCLRKVSYGNSLEISATHQACLSPNDKDTEHAYTIDVNHFISASKRIDPTSLSSLFGVTLANGQVVKIQPIRFKSFVKLMQSVQEEVSVEEEMNDLICALGDVIIQVDEVVDRTNIEEWLRLISPADLILLNAGLEQTLVWGPDFTVDVQCKDCSESMSVVAHLSAITLFT